MSHVILIVCNALNFRSEVDGHFIEDFTPDTDPMGRGMLLVTRDIRKAKQFSGYVEAWEYWRQQSHRVPFRPDGQPNRPLTAYHVEILKYPVASPEN